MQPSPRQRPSRRKFNLSIPALLVFLLSLSLCAFGSGLSLAAVRAAPKPRARTTVLTSLLPAQAAATATGSAIAVIPAPTLAPLPSPTPVDPVAAVMAGMTTEDKIGQLLMPGLSASAEAAEAIRLIAVSRVGGLWLMDRDRADAAQVQQLIARLNDVQRRSGLPARLFIAVDDGAPAGDSDLVFQRAVTQAQELRALGINMNFGLGLDVHSDAVEMTNFGIQSVRGERQAGLIGVVKHFPGDLLSALDDRIALETIALLPFKAAIAQGVPGVMVGHFRVPALDPDWPASLSPRIIDGYLRGQLRFDGVVFTDDVTRPALAHDYEAGEAAVLAVLAGADVIVIGDPASTVHIRNALRAALTSGRLSPARLDQSVQRILRLKAGYGLIGDRLPVAALPATRRVSPTRPVSPHR